jgi:hypothetical protein
MPAARACCSIKGYVVFTAILNAPAVLAYAPVLLICSPFNGNVDCY